MIIILFVVAEALSRALRTAREILRAKVDPNVTVSQADLTNRLDLETNNAVGKDIIRETQCKQARNQYYLKLAAYVVSTYCRIIESIFLLPSRSPCRRPNH